MQTNNNHPYKEWSKGLKELYSFNGSQNGWMSERKALLAAIVVWFLYRFHESTRQNANFFSKELYKYSTQMIGEAFSVGIKQIVPLGVFYNSHSLPLIKVWRWQCEHINLIRFSHFENVENRSVDPVYHLFNIQFHSFVYFVTLSSLLFHWMILYFLPAIHSIVIMSRCGKFNSRSEISSHSFFSLFVVVSLSLSALQSFLIFSLVLCILLH